MRENPHFQKNRARIRTCVKPGGGFLSLARHPTKDFFPERRTGGGSHCSSTSQRSRVTRYHSRAVKPRTFRPGIYAPLDGGLLLLDVLLNNAQRCPATTGGEAGSRPQDINDSLNLDPAPVFRVRHSAHPVSGLCAGDHVIAPVESHSALGVVQTRLLGKAHAPFQHRVIPKSKIRRLMALRTFTVRRPVINVVLHSL